MKIYIALTYQVVLELDTSRISSESILYLLNEAKAFKTDGWSHSPDRTYTESTHDLELIKIQPSQLAPVPELDIKAVMEENNRLQRELDLLKAKSSLSDSKELMQETN